MTHTSTSNELPKKPKLYPPWNNTGLLLSYSFTYCSLVGRRGSIGSSIAIWRHLKTHQCRCELAELKTNFQKSQARI